MPSCSVGPGWFPLPKIPYSSRGLFASARIRALVSSRAARSRLFFSAGPNHAATPKHKKYADQATTRPKQTHHKIMRMACQTPQKWWRSVVPHPVSEKNVSKASSLREEKNVSKALWMVYCVEGGWSLWMVYWRSTPLGSWRKFPPPRGRGGLSLWDKNSAAPESWGFVLRVLGPARARENSTPLSFGKLPALPGLGILLFCSEFSAHHVAPPPDSEKIVSMASSPMEEIVPE